MGSPTPATCGRGLASRLGLGRRTTSPASKGSCSADRVGLFFDRPDGNSVFSTVGNPPVATSTQSQWGFLQTLQNAQFKTGPVPIVTSLRVRRETAEGRAVERRRTDRACRGPRPSISSTSAITPRTSSARAAAPTQPTSTRSIWARISAGWRRRHRHDLDDGLHREQQSGPRVPRLRQHQHQHGPLLSDVPFRAGVVQPPVQPRSIVRREL